VAIVRPRLFLDTNICINVANGKIGAADWRRVQKCINSDYRYFISFISLKELFTKVARGPDDYFDRNKGSLRVLYAPSKRTFLPYPSVFALRTVLGIKSAARAYPAGMTEEKLGERMLKAVLDSPSKTHLKKGIPVRNNRRQMQSFDLDRFDTHENTPQNEHANLLQGIRDGGIEMPVPKQWAASILHQHGETPYTDRCEKLASGLDAAFRFTCVLSGMAKDRGYDFKAHASDWGDTLQLFYLSDESMYFLTWDKDFISRTKGSPQSSRILYYPEFVRSLLP